MVIWTGWTGSTSLFSGEVHSFFWYIAWLITISRCYKDVCVNKFFRRTAKLWISLLIESFSLTYDEIALSLELTDTF